MSIGCDVRLRALLLGGGRLVLVVLELELDVARPGADGDLLLLLRLLALDRLGALALLLLLLLALGADALDGAEDRPVLAGVDVALLEEDLVDPDEAALLLVDALLLLERLLDPLGLADVALDGDLAVEAVRLADEVVEDRVAQALELLALDDPHVEEHPLEGLLLVLRVHDLALKLERFLELVLLDHVVLEDDPAHDVVQGLRHGRSSRERTQTFDYAG